MRAAFHVGDARPRRRAGKRAAALGALALVALASRAEAGSWPSELPQALPCRPTIACTADLVPPGAVEVEGGYAARRLGSSWQQQTPFLVKLTLVEWLQLQVGGNGGVFLDGSGWFDELVAGLKLRLHERRGDEPSVAISAELAAPMPATRGYLPTWGALVTLFVTREFGRVHADLNLGVNAWRLEGTPRLQPFAALSLSTELPHRLTPMLEAYVFDDAAPVAPRDAGLLTALAWAPWRWLVLDAGLDVGLTSTRALTLFVGFTVITVDLFDTAAERRRRRR